MNSENRLNEFNDKINDEENETQKTNDTSKKGIASKISEEEEPWVLIESYFRNQHLKQLIRHQIENFNYMVNSQLEQTIAMFNPIRICSEHDYIKEQNLHRLVAHVTLENFNIHRPQVYENNGATKIMFPQEARLRNFTYAGAMTVDLNIKYTVRNGENYKNTQIYNKVLKNIHIGKLPIMLQSDICVLSQYNHLTKQANVRWTQVAILSSMVQKRLVSRKSVLRKTKLLVLIFPKTILNGLGTPK
jgi:DNA-directed RNA polymerase beta subunit